MCWWSLSGESSWTTVRHRVGRKFFVVVWSVVMDDCQSSCRSYVFCRVCRHGRLSVVVQSYVFGRCQLGSHGRLSFVVWVVMSVIVSVICWLSLSGRSSWTTVRRRVGHMFFVESFVMDDCQTLCQSYGFRRCQVCRQGRLSVVVSVVCFVSGLSSWTTVTRRVSHMFLVIVKSVVMDDCLSLFGSSCR